MEQFLDVNISSINQKAGPEFINPIGDSKIIPFGLDGALSEEYNRTGNKLSEQQRRVGATIWFDVRVIESCK